MPFGMVHERPLKLPNPYVQGFNVKMQTFVGPKAYIRVCWAVRNRDHTYNKTALRENIRGHRS